MFSAVGFRQDAWNCFYRMWLHGARILSPQDRLTISLDVKRVLRVALFGEFQEVELYPSILEQFANSLALFKELSIGTPRGNADIC